MSGFFITLEGPDGSGKGTILKYIENYFSIAWGSILYPQKNLGLLNPTFARCCVISF